MEKNSEKSIRPETKPKTYISFKNRCQNQAINFLTDENIQDSFGQISDLWDEIEFISPEFEKHTEKTRNQLLEKLEDSGLKMIPYNISDVTAIHNPVVSEMARDHVNCWQIHKMFTDSSGDAHEELGKIELEKQTSRAYIAEFLSDVIDMKMAASDYEIVAIRNRDLLKIPDEAFSVTTELFAKCQKIISISKILNSSRTLGQIVKDKPRVVLNKSQAQTYLSNLAYFVTGGKTHNYEEIVKMLDNMIESTITRLFDKYGEFIELDKAPEAMQNKLRDFMEVRDQSSAPLPNGIIGKPLDDLISEDIEPDDRSRFMFIYTLRSLLEWDDDQYLDAVYTEKYEDK